MRDMLIEIVLNYNSKYTDRDYYSYDNNRKYWEKRGRI